MEPKCEKSIEKNATFTSSSLTDGSSCFEKLRISSERSQTYKLKGRISNPYNPLPKYMFKIKNLKEADLSSNRQAGFRTHMLEFVPIELTKLHTLRIINLDFNKIETLPEEIGNLKYLETLTISQNRLCYLPDSIVNLRRLKSLHLSQNLFKTFPKVVCYLKALRFLDISMNKIESIPEQIENLSPTLETLILIDNCIAEIPEGLCKCTHLLSLFLASNNVRTLPKSFLQLKKLDWSPDNLEQICIDGNPMVHPPMKTCKLGLKEIFKYLETN